MTTPLTHTPPPSKHWVLQENIYAEKGYAALLDILQRTSTPHTLVKVIPFVGEIIPDIDIPNPVVCIGQYSMRHTSKKKGWNPGVWDLEDKADYAQCMEKWNLMLNSGAQIVKLKDIETEARRGIINQSRSFFRPLDDSKHFAGGIYDLNHMIRLYRNTMALNDEERLLGLSPDSLIVCASPTDILAEYRTWFVDGKLVTASQYKLGDLVAHSADVSEDVLNFAQDMAEIWQPDRAFVLDICRIEAGLRILEVNTINAAGFYAADVFKIWDAIQQYPV